MSKFKVGDRVEVEGFGEGTIEEINHTDDYLPCWIVFDNGMHSYFDYDELTPLRTNADK